jgi:hypothetical protein
MNRISIRATYALDEQTSRRIKRLAKDWCVSQAEVIRRAVKAAAEESTGQLTPANVVARYAKDPPPRSQVQTWRVIRSLRALRDTDDKHRTRLTGK